MSTSADTFSIAQLRDFRDSQKDKKYQIEVPSFQRGLVWSPQKKTNLIHSISNGFPIGALLMYERQSGDGPTVLQIIDGLQRSTAILEYVRRPLEIAPVADDFISSRTYELLASCCLEHGVDINADVIKDCVDTWAKETGEAQAGKGFTPKKLREEIKSRAEEAFDSEWADDIDELIASEIIQVLSDKFQALSDYQIPVILYSGDESNLPHIFEALNSGTPLTKYDKFGATWNTIKVITKSKEIRSAVRDRYRVYADRDWEVSDFNPNVEFEEDELNLFEYLGGLGHILSVRFPNVFSAHRDEDEVASWAFALATLAHGLRLSEMGELPSKFARNSSDVIDPTKFEHALLHACEVLESTLSQYLSLKLNTKSGSDRFIPHSENQVNSWIVRIMIEGFDGPKWDKKSGATQESTLAHNLLAHYLFDILKDNWKGSGDSTAYKRIWDEQPDKTIKPASYYLQAITADEMTKALDDFHAGELKKSQSNRANISMKTRLLLRVLYADIISYKDNKTVQFDIEHLHTVKELTEFLKQEGISGLPISAIGNLAILPEKDNYTKGKIYLGDYLATKEKTPAQLEKLQAYVIAPPINEIRLASLTSEESYLEFCNQRFKTQTEQILKTLHFS